MDKIVEDDELGRLIVRVNSRARSLVFRTKSDAVYVSVPPGTTLKEVKQAIENLRGKLLASRQKLARPLIDLDYKLMRNTLSCPWCPVKRISFWLIPGWGLWKLFVRLMRILRTRNCKAGCIR